MYELDKEKFGVFLVQLRKEKGMTQKELAEKLYVSDKAVSKWERGLSLPDISLLQPIAEQVEVSVTELLNGQRIPPDQPLTVQEVEPLVTGALSMNLTMTPQEQEEQREHRRTWGKRFIASILILGAEVPLLGAVVPLWDAFAACLILPPLMAVIFGSYFIFGVKEKIPAFYDQYPLSFYGDNFFHMSIPGVRFNNRNWPHILRALRIWSCVTMSCWTPVYGLTRWMMGALGWPEAAQFGVLFPLMMGGVLGGMFIPIYVVGRKYE